MRQLIYRLSWDKEYKRKFIIICSSSLCVAVLCLLFIPLGIHFVQDRQNNEIVEEVESNNGAKYNIEFNDQTFQKDENTSDVNNTNNNSNDNKSKESNSMSNHQSINNNTQIDVPPEHVHSWYTVIDSYPWDETVYIQTGTKYICRNCGYICFYQESADRHASQHEHGYRTEPVMEARTIHHDGTSHEECSCGARR